MHFVLRTGARIVSAVVGLAILGLVVGAIVLARSYGLAPELPLGAGAPASMLTADELKAGAATKLEDATAKDGSGYAFEIVQTSTITAKPGGPLVNIPNPSNGWEVIGQTDEYLFYSLIERGIVTADGFWSEMRRGPVPGQKPDFDAAELRRSALVRDGKWWRNDRDGWYESELVPGIGLDPETAALLPTLLRDTTDASKRSDEVVDGASLLRVDATADKADMPGIVASGGVTYTRLIAPVEFGFDEQGRLGWIHSVALNQNLTDWDLVVDTVITLRYDGVGNLPAPQPAWVPAATGEDTGR